MISRQSLLCHVALSICITALASYVCSCRIQKGILLQASAPLPWYVHSVIAANGRKGPVIAFPTVQIYNVSGKLIFQSHDVNENISLFQKTPFEVENFVPISNSVPLEQSIKGIPGFEAEMSRVGRSPSVTVVVISLEGCHACSLLDETLNKTQQQLLNGGINLFPLTIDQPSWA